MKTGHVSPGKLSEFKNRDDHASGPRPQAVLEPLSEAVKVTDDTGGYQAPDAARGPAHQNLLVPPQSSAEDLQLQVIYVHIFLLHSKAKNLH